MTRTAAMGKTEKYVLFFLVYLFMRLHAAEHVLAL